ncbi:MAG TPA: Gfo/Idh/MocA family oxidoreductase [Anaerohalosphaeraceae bacterium]|nr:Gfo/Idh/MocA family oxidoreductase [Anaerohalosphaeraceae bacterium]HRT50549.1 Gfo/Idh/MocA family oxidoreductase [Anaerohalosphaeraceae bacterium]HRT86511.1 Gfo/Idh/MocA family oxidoreductase [Anaerohalosphaeraceae bacterium]
MQNLHSIAAAAFAPGSDKIRVGVIGCGSRGTGAAKNCVDSSPNVEIVALGDTFKDRVDACLKMLKANDPAEKSEWSASGPWRNADKVTATPETCFTGFDAYKQVIACDVDLVILATPPHFRPIHLKAAVEAGKHVFMEKPVAVDPVGIRSVLASSELAKQKGLAICAGTQRRHDPQYIEVMKRIHAGQIGDLLGGECYWVQGWVRQWGFWHERRPEWSDMEWQVRNWYYFTWLSGDHIVEQHVHNIDVTNWAMGTPPVQIMSLGGRQVRIEPEFGNIYDHFGVEFEYPNGTRVLSMARQIAGCTDIIGERIVGATGTARAGVIEGANPWTYTGPRPNPYEQEHADLIASIRAATPINEGRQVAESTLCAIAARMSAYTGREMKYDWVLKASKLDLSPKEYKFGPIPVAPVAVPGQTPLT